MDFADSIRTHAKRIADKHVHAYTEEATKTGLVMPFLQVLGYDPFDPQIVIPEYCADFGDKKSCKVDYAIKRGGDVVIIIEAKKVGDTLDGNREGQLQRYFQSLLSVKIAVLTDGIVYKFFTDLEHANVMDKKPFMIFDFSAMDEALIPELKKLCNDCFDLGTALCAAQELKYLGQLKRAVAVELEQYSDDFVRFFARQVYDGKLTSGVVEDFRPRVRLAFENHLNDVLNARLQNAMQVNTAPAIPAEETPETEGGSDRDNRIVTTAEEIEGFHIVRAIMSKVTDPDKVVMRDTISYCGILYEDNNRQPICRLYFNNPENLQIEVFDAERKASKHKLERVSDISRHSDALRAVVACYAHA